MIIVAACALLVVGVAVGVLATTHRGALIPGLHSGPPPGYLYHTSDIAMYVQWTLTGSSVSGTIEASYIDPSDATQVTTATDAITGVIASGNITLTIDKSVLGTTNLSGTFDGSTLTLTIPNSDGILTRVTFSPASLADYNVQVSALQRQAQEALQAQQKAQAQAAVQAAQEQAEETVNQAISTVEDDLSTLSSDASFSSVLSAVSGSINQADTDLTSTQQAAQAEESEAQQYPNGDYGQVCSDADEVSSDADTVSADADSVEASANSVEDALQGARSDIGSLQSDFSQLATDEGNVPQYHPPSPPTAEIVNAAIAAAQQSISQALSTTNGAIAQANSDVTAAFTAAGQAFQAGNCGTSPSPPEGEQPIS